MSQPPPGMTQPIQYPPPAPAKKRRNRLLIGVGTVLAICVVCGVIGLVAVARSGGSATPTVAAQAPTSVPSGTTVAAVGAQATSAPTGAAAKPTDAAKPTATVKPEATVKPTNTPVPPPKVYGLNELASVKNWDLAVNNVVRPGKELVWSQYGNTSTAAGTWFVVVVDMKNTGNTNFGVNTTDLELLAANGITYKVSTDGGASYEYSGYKGAQRIGGQVPPGVNVTYHVVFDVAPNATDLKLVFKQDKNPTFAVGNAAP
jgi:hypothetical protein